MDYSKFWWTNPPGDGPLPPTDSIPNSLRFRGGSWLSRIAKEPFNSQLFTLSFWVKRSTLGGEGVSDVCIQYSGVDKDNKNDRLQFTTANALEADQRRNVNDHQTTTNAIFRDPNAWYHIVYTWVSGYKRLAVNGVWQSYSRDNSAAQTHYWQTAGSLIELGRDTNNGGTPVNYFDGYIAEYYYIDGQALEPTAFGHFNEAGVWVPKQVDFAPSAVTYSDTCYLSQPTVGIDLSTTMPLPQPTSGKYSFDGDLNTMGNSTQPNTGWVWRPARTITAQNSLRIHLNNLAPNGDEWPVQSIYLNDTNTPIVPEQQYTADQWIDLPVTYPVTIEALGMKGGGTNWAGGYIGAIEVDGEILIDPYVWSDQVTLVGQGSEGGFAPHQAPTNMFDGKTNTYCISQASNQSIKWVPDEPIHYNDSVAIWSPSAPGANMIYLYYEGEEVAVVPCLENQWTYLTREAGVFDQLSIYGSSTDARCAGVLIDNVLWVDGQVPGGYGSNGCHLTFEDANDVGKDYSGNENHWDASGFSTVRSANYTTSLAVDTDTIYSYPNESIGFNAPFEELDNNYVYLSPGGGPNTLTYTFDTPIVVTGSLTVIVQGGSSADAYGSCTLTINYADGTSTATPFLDVGSSTLVSVDINVPGFGDAITSLVLDNPYPVSGALCGGFAGLKINGSKLLLSTSANPVFYDMMKDSPTQNYAVLNRLNQNNPPNFAGSGRIQYNNGNLGSNSASSYASNMATINPQDNIYWEISYYQTPTSTTYSGLSYSDTNQGNVQGPWWGYYTSQGISSKFIQNGVEVAGNENTLVFTKDDVAGYRLEGGNLYIYKNGLQTGSVNLADADPNKPLFINHRPNGTEQFFINFGQQPFVYAPEGVQDLQTNILPEPPIKDGRDHFQILTGAGPTTGILNVTQTGNANYTLTYHMGGDGTGETPTDGYAAGTSDPPTGISNAQLNPAQSLNFTMMEKNGIGTGNGGSRGQRHSNKFVFDPPLTGPVEFQVSLFTGVNQNSMLINGIAQNTSAMSSSEQPYKVFNDDITEIVTFGDSAMFNTWFTIRSVGGVAGGPFIDNVFEVTVEDATGFNQGDYITSAAGSPGYISAVDGNVLTIESPYTDGWEVGGSILEEVPILERAKEMFPNGVWWTKSRKTTGNHQLMDSVRGGDFALYPNTANSETSYIDPGTDAVAWCWKAGDTKVTDNTGSLESQVTVNHDAGFSIVEWVGNGGFESVGHGLGKRPGLVITRSRQGDHWCVGHDSVNTLSSGGAPSQWVNNDSFVASNWAGGLFLDDDNASMSINANSGINKSGENMIAYVWTPIPGYSAFGSYTGNGSIDGCMSQLDFKPSFVLIKRVDNSYGGEWSLYDGTRLPYNPVTNPLVVNTADPEYNVDGIDLLSNGFKCRAGDGSWVGIANAQYIYIAFAQSPFGGLHVSPATAR